MTTPVTARGNADTYRTFMRSFPTGVAVVTTMDDRERPVGFTCSSLCGLSLTPPLLLVCVSNLSSTLAHIRNRGQFAVNLLNDRGRAAADHFARPHEDRFIGTAWQPTPVWGLPFLVDAAHAVTECRVKRIEVAGDHTIVIGALEAVTFDGDNPAPLMHGFGSYRVWSESAM